ncbi:unnamed protein product, partial [Oppiella nova]
MSANTNRGRGRLPKTSTAPKRHSIDPILSQYSYDSSEDIYSCQVCDYRTRNRLYVRQHMVSHSQYRPYRCREVGCAQTYKRPQEL